MTNGDVFRAASNTVIAEQLATALVTGIQITLDALGAQLTDEEVAEKIEAAAGTYKEFLDSPVEAGEV